MARKIESAPLTASKIGTYLTCPYQYFLDTQIRENNIPITGFTAKHYWLENAFRNLFPEERHVGRDLDDIESLRGGDLAQHLKYKSAEAFGNATREGWRRYVIEQKGNVHDRDVVWLFKNQWWKAQTEIQNACANYYIHILEEGAPIIGFQNKEVAFYHDDKKYIARFDALRRGMNIYEYGTGKRTKKEMRADWKITLQVLAYCTVAHAQEAYRIKWGVDEDLALEWGGTKMYIDPRVTYNYVDLSNNETSTTTRSDADLPLLIETIENAQQGIENLTFTANPSRKNCGACRYNVLNKVGETICGKKDSNAPTLTSMGDVIEAAEKLKLEIDTRET